MVKVRYEREKEDVAAAFTALGNLMEAIYKSRRGRESRGLEGEVEKAEAVLCEAARQAAQTLALGKEEK